MKRGQRNPREPLGKYEHKDGEKFIHHLDHADEAILLTELLVRPQLLQVLQLNLKAALVSQ
jgi:hypothetical protein